MKVLLKRINQAKLSNRLLFTKTLVYLIFTKIIIKLFLFELIKKIYGLLIKLPKIGNYNIDNVLNTIRWVTTKYPNSFTCLQKSLVIKFFFRSDNSVKIIIGVSINSGVFEAHSWVEKDGEIIFGDQPNSNFNPIWEWC